MSKENALNIASGFTLILTHNGEVRVATIGAGYETVASEPIESLSKSEVSRAIKEAFDRRDESFKNCQHSSFGLVGVGWTHYNLKSYNDGRRCQSCGRREVFINDTWVEDEIK